MGLNYLLLGVTGAISLANALSLFRGRGWLGSRCLAGVAAMVVFVLVLCATARGLDYNTFRGLLESGLG